MLRYTFKRDDMGSIIEAAVNRVLATGARTADIARGGDDVIGTRDMGERIRKAIKAG